MNSADLLVLEQIGITELLAHSHQWAGLAEPAAHPDGTAEEELHALGRLERLGLVARSDRPVAGGVSLTAAGVEALAYLATAA